MTLTTWLMAGAGLVIGWLLRALLAARTQAAAARIAADLHEGFEVELMRARRDVEMTAAERTRLQRELAVSAQAGEALRAEAAAQARALGEAQRDRDRASERAEAAIAARRIADERGSELEGHLAELGELRRAARILSEQRTGLAARLEQLTLHGQRLESERTRAVLMAESLERQLKQVIESGQASRALQATELLDLKRQLEVASKQIEQVSHDQAAAVSERDELTRRLADIDHERRTAAVAHQEALAVLQAQLGGVHALAERAEPLRRQLEDREGLIRSVAEERDEATRAVIRQERESMAVKAELERELGRLRGLEADLADQTKRAAIAESRLATGGRDRDEHAAAARTARIEIESLKAEIKDRDLRFRTLLDDRRYFVEQSQDQIARLREDMTRSRLAGGNDLKQITGIGPHLEGKLKQLGVTTFRQIAEWSETDIAQISKELGPFAHRIRRDRWIEQARRAGKLEGEPAA